MKKRIFASLLAICMLATSVFAAAGDVIFQDGFEADYADGLYISKPAIRAYGENLFTIGDFSADPKTGYASNFKVAYNNPGGYIVQKDGLMQFTTSFGRTGGSMYSRTASSGTPAGYPITIGIPVANMKGNTIYELEMWLKNDPTLKDAEGNPVKVHLPVWTTGSETVYYTSETAKTNKSIADSLSGVTLLNPIGSQQMIGVTSGDNTYTRFSARFSINADVLANYKNNSYHGQNYLPITLNIGWNKSGTNASSYSELGRIFVDDVSFREVLNATASTVNGQEGMPVYNDARIAGQAAEIVFDAVNETGAAKDITLITAQYNADGSLNAVLDKQVVTVAETANRQHITADITMPASVDGEIKVFAWDGTTLLTPYADAAGSEDLTYLAGSNREGKNLPGSRLWKTGPQPEALDNDGLNYAAELTSVGSSEGVQALYVPAGTRYTVTDDEGNESKVSGETRVYASFNTEVGKKYRLTFDYQNYTYETFGFALAGGSADSTKPVKTMKSPIGTISAPQALAGVLATTTKENAIEHNSIRFRSPNGAETGNWKQFTYEFTANGEKMWMMFGPECLNGLSADNIILNAAGTNLGSANGARNRAYGALVDNIKVVELAD